MARPPPVTDPWNAGPAYEAYVGRWSRLVARDLVRNLDAPPHARWLDAGCGTGALIQAILDEASPRLVVGVDRTVPFVRHARAMLAGPRLAFLAGDALALPVASGGFDVIVSGLVLNFVADPARMVAEMVRAARARGTVAIYVWDYAGRMEMLRHFWDAAVALDPEAAALDEGVRFPVCAPTALRELLTGAGLSEVTTQAIDVVTRFRDFDDCWSPFLGGQGPAPGYVAGLPAEGRAALRASLRSRLPVAGDGSISLVARAWAARGLAGLPGRRAPARPVTPSAARRRR
jgi:SAM-dependent methyltransferase